MLPDRPFASPLSAESYAMLPDEDWGCDAQTLSNFFRAETDEVHPSLLESIRRRFARVPAAQNKSADPAVAGRESTVESAAAQPASPKPRTKVERNTSRNPSLFGSLFRR